MLLSGHEKAILKEMVEVLEPFKEATDILQGDYVSISFSNTMLLWPTEASVIEWCAVL